MYHNHNHNQQQQQKKKNKQQQQQQQQKSFILRNVFEPLMKHESKLC
jgi:DNA-binding TFAR19-related protein (PDSD5 family)